MAKNEIRGLVLVLSLIFTGLIGVAAETEPSSLFTCSITCAIECLLTKSPLCVADCLKRCKFQVLEAVSSCTYSCASSSCTNFTSDAKKLKGCVGSCYKNCSYDI